MQTSVGPPLVLSIVCYTLRYAVLNRSSTYLSAVMGQTTVVVSQPRHLNNCNLTSRTPQPICRRGSGRCWNHAHTGHSRRYSERHSHMCGDTGVRVERSG